MKKFIKPLILLLCAAICFASLASCSLLRKQTDGTLSDSKDSQTSSFQTDGASSESDKSPDSGDFADSDDSGDGKNDQSGDAAEDTVVIDGENREVSLSVGDGSAEISIEGEDTPAEIEYPDSVSDVRKKFVKASFDDLDGDGVGDLVIMYKEGDGMHAMAYLRNAESGEYEYFPELSQ